MDEKKFVMLGDHKMCQTQCQHYNCPNDETCEGYTE